MAIHGKKLEYGTSCISEQQFNAHIKLYNGYVEKVNQITKELKKDGDPEEANAIYSKWRGLKAGETYALDGVILHELYFEGMTIAGETAPQEKTLDIFNYAFGSYEDFVKDFTATAKAARGYAILVFEQRSGTFRNIMLDSQNDGLVCGAYPLIVLDMYEHAYFLDYETEKANYIKAFIDAINWNVVELRVNMLLK